LQTYQILVVNGWAKHCKVAIFFFFFQLQNSFQNNCPIPKEVPQNFRDLRKT
jgi:hypothetical protein